MASDSAIKTISIYFGTETGHSRSIAETIAQKADANNLKTTIHDLADIRGSQLTAESNPSVFIVSTWEKGKPPFLARRFFDELKVGEIKAPHMRFTVIALGDESYKQFCQCGKTLDSLLESTGAKRFMPRTEVGRNYMKGLEAWMPLFFKTLSTLESSKA